MTVMSDNGCTNYFNSKTTVAFSQNRNKSVSMSICILVAGI